MANNDQDQYVNFEDVEENPSNPSNPSNQPENTKTKQEVVKSG